MEGIQNRQIYRGTQVEEDDLRGFDAMNITRSSKSSTKTKIPRNYLAVNDFINSGSTQRKPHWLVDRLKNNMIFIFIPLQLCPILF